MEEGRFKPTETSEGVRHNTLDSSECYYTTNKAKTLIYYI